MDRLEPSSTDALESKARAGLSAFQSSGVHVLDPYISPAARSAPALGLVDSRAPRAQPPAGQDAPGPSGRNSIWAGHIPADNVGFQLLRKAGWSVGTGLGVEEQGRREPIEPVLPKGTRGLGFDSRSSTQQQQQHRHEQRAVRKRAVAAEGAPAEGGEPPQGGRRSRTTGAAAAAALVQEEFAKESLSDKVSYHKQMMRTEREQARGRAIEVYLRSAFNDPFDHLHSDNSNPLSRSHKLTGTNPLLDPIGD